MKPLKPWFSGGVLGGIFFVSLGIASHLYGFRCILSLNNEPSALDGISGLLDADVENPFCPVQAWMDAYIFQWGTVTNMGLGHWNEMARSVRTQFTPSQEGIIVLLILNFLIGFMIFALLTFFLHKKKEGA